MNRRITIAALVHLILAGLATAAETGWDDPAGIAPPPSWAIGFPSRATDLDAWPGFQKPPPGYGEVAFYWWLGDPLTKERLAWQLDRLADRGVMGLQINYAHSDWGGLSWGLTYPSDPPLFSDAWWELVDWFIGEAYRRGMTVSLSDYTLGIGQGWTMDAVIESHPELNGSVLEERSEIVDGGRVEWVLPAETLMVAAHDLRTGEALDLRDQVIDGVLEWNAPPGERRITAVWPRAVRPSIDPMHSDSGALYASAFFGQFEQRHPGQCGRGLNFFFSDELDFRVRGNLWTERMAAEFQRRKGYDLIPLLPALFHDVGPATPKIRLDYRDVMVALTEEGFFKPVFDWHQDRGMIFG
ncbi:MAG: glycosyl hydrolase, partial [Planctomycetota bacterium]